MEIPKGKYMGREQDRSRMTREQREREKQEALELLRQIEEEEKQDRERKKQRESSREERRESPREEKRESPREEKRESPHGEQQEDPLLQMWREEQEETGWRKKKRKKRKDRDEEEDDDGGGRGHTLGILVAILLMLVICAIGMYLYIRLAPTKQKADLLVYFENMNRDSGGDGKLAGDELAVVLQDRGASGKARMIDDNLYLEYYMVRAALSSRFYWDEPNQMMLYTTADRTCEIPVNSSVWSDGEQEQDFGAQILVQDKRGLWINADYVRQYTNVEYVVSPETYHVLVNYRWENRLEATAKKDCPVRVLGGIKSPILTTVLKDENLCVLETLEKWSRVVTGDGFIGYVRNTMITDPETKDFTRAFEEPVYENQVRDHKINLVWHQIDNADMNKNLKNDIANMTGVNVISPTWFFLSDNEGNFDSFANKTYVKRAHKAGLEVWGLVSNFSPDMQTSALVASTEARRNLVKNLIDEALRVNLDGINVDLEAISSEAGYGYVQFIRELSVECRKNQLVLSVDIPVPMDFNTHYDRKELGTVADYVIIMGYDEHYSGSEAGSVASLSFEENGIKGTLSSVPAEKIISGIPFYTRLWFSQLDENGEEAVWSQVWGMNVITNTLKSFNVTPEWNEETQQNYAVWDPDEGVTCQVWIEDEESIALKASLVKEYKLGGIAAWVLGDQRDTIWDVISENIE